MTDHFLLYKYYELSYIFQLNSDWKVQIQFNSIQENLVYDGIMNSDFSKSCHDLKGAFDDFRLPNLELNDYNLS